MNACPHCNKPIECMYEAFAEHDYRTYFDMQCPHCDGTIEVIVSAIPEFELCKKSAQKISEG